MKQNRKHFPYKMVKQANNEFNKLKVYQFTPEIIKFVFWLVVKLIEKFYISRRSTEAKKCSVIDYDYIHIVVIEKMDLAAARNFFLGMQSSNYFLRTELN